MVGDEAVQQRALKCIFAYNYKYVTPYRFLFVLCALLMRFSKLEIIRIEKVGILD